MIELAFAAFIWVITIGIALVAIASVVGTIMEEFLDARVDYEAQRRQEAERKCKELSEELRKIKEQK